MSDLTALHEKVGRLDGKLDFLVDSERNRQRQLEQHDQRIRKLERGWAKLFGFLAFIPVACTAVWKFLTGNNKS